MFQLVVLLLQVVGIGLSSAALPHFLESASGSFSQFPLSLSLVANTFSFVCSL